MKPTSKPTKLEVEGGFKEYKGLGKLNDKRVIISNFASEGGEVY